MADMSTDYLVQGAGATGLAFVDSLLDHPSDDEIVVVDRHDHPGGHWNDAYPFVRLHQPAATYGLASSPLGHDRVETDGMNSGFFDLATKSEILAHYGSVLRNRFLPSGRVRYFAKSEVQAEPDGRSATIRHLATGAVTRVEIRKRLVTSIFTTEVPATHPPRFHIAEGVRCIPVNGLVDLERPYGTYTVIGAGKTGIDACLWLLGHGVEPERIRWVMPRDSWFVPRENMQPGIQFLTHTIAAQIMMTEEIMAADSADDLLRRFEARKLLYRLDRDVWPTMFRCANVSTRELTQLRRIGNVIRLGRVEAVERERLVLRDDTIPADPDTLYVHCAAHAFNADPASTSECPTFEPGRIHLNVLRFCQPAFSSAVIGRIETLYADDAARNAVAKPIPIPKVPHDWLRIQLATYGNAASWKSDPRLDEWAATCRLNLFATGLAGARKSDPDALALLSDWRERARPAAEKLRTLIARMG
ncbi:hypothetical protein [Trinickia acidisoli]|uniref:hypothetical protein n=1 Tax=Trinickia acidisoli TaxID=2767482 RepID=UPI001A8C6BC5|nr:hypothetical protein [Trinickia acidisoli]